MKFDERPYTLYQGKPYRYFLGEPLLIQIIYIVGALACASFVALTFHMLIFSKNHPFEILFSGGFSLFAFCTIILRTTFKTTETTLLNPIIGEHYVDNVIYTLKFTTYFCWFLPIFGGEPFRITFKEDSIHYYTKDFNKPFIIPFQNILSVVKGDDAPLWYRNTFLAFGFIARRATLANSMFSSYNAYVCTKYKQHLLEFRNEEDCRLFMDTLQTLLKQYDDNKTAL
ncbi:hypothetical protein HN512_01490 [Candidatus Peregrinibacteria bacterium]|jgi:hypothetical protein|nr:hypothetical protein [Candidatus Peregrinibacteria bacterium]MBT3598489.1 hypothetical protein [Candidatus Peregrinibacteria bacterium]MBT6730508.1 hypothetical protein [Candidatus Peregrinibacteria bacterium]MBT7009378.1 hypothetical protein [Candidatus Peregrinibacteria bacterium]MBT7345305.1 hypothetical protein [Candidatus Peregrinibacteria bacterium]